MKVISEWRTDVGRVRKLNEDSVYIERDENLLNERGELLIVADGMGGHQSGEVASEQAVESIKKGYYTDLLDEPGQMLKKAIEEAGDAEERRLFYVAVTRAEDELFLCSPMVRRQRDGGMIFLDPSRFISEIPEDCLQQDGGGFY